MKVIRKQIKLTSRSSHIKIVPIGDIHLGAAACDERLFRDVVSSIADDENAYWILMGDAINAINVQDPRFNPEDLAPWIKMQQLSDLAKAETERFLKIIQPIASKCLAALTGNHEEQLKKHNERDIHSEIVSGIKQLGGMSVDEKLSLGYYGWLQLCFRRSGGSGKQINLNLHHGMGGGRGAGGKANRIQQWIWNHDADIVIFGHTHNTSVQVEAVESINTSGKVSVSKRFGCYSGTFLKTGIDGRTTYSEEKGYSALPLGGIAITIKPFHTNCISVQAS